MRNEKKKGSRRGREKEREGKAEGEEKKIGRKKKKKGSKKALVRLQQWLQQAEPGLRLLYCWSLNIVELNPFLSGIL